jgi:mitochondrial fission protein ELM1
MQASPKLYSIDLNKNVSEITGINPESLDLAFVVPNFHLGSSAGSMRVALDTAWHLARAFSVEPVFLTHDQANVKETNVADFLQVSPRAMVIGINRSYHFLERELNARFVSVGMNDIHSPCLQDSFDIVLSPVFNPAHLSFGAICKRKVGGADKKERVVVPYTCLPSRIFCDIATFDPFGPPKPFEPKKIMAYIRDPSMNDLFDMLAQFEKLQNENGARFLISTGPATTQSVKEQIQKALPKLKGSEYYFFDEDPGQNNNPYMTWMRLADAFVVTNDTISTLSDAATTGRPVFLAGTEVGMQMQENPYDNMNRKLQAELIRHKRLKPFTIENFLSDWKPPVVDEWKFVGGRVREIVEARRASLPTSAPI